ncbi:MAG: UPF0102 protein [Rhodothalassiaceae bacterium]|nr:MAG: UPF0102 protein [Rhodothalassiaceae bacterium]
MARRRDDAAARRRAERAGRLAERLVALGYRLAGWRLLARRVRTPHGELDLVMRRGGTLLFVEVKLRARGGAAFVADEIIPPHQRRRLARAAASYLARARMPDAAVRFDAVIWERGRLPRRLENVIWEDEGR